MDEVKISSYIDDFLTFLRDCTQQYHMAVADEEERNNETQDILHSIELEDHDYHELAKLAKDIREVRQQRRVAKDTIATTTPVLDWIDTNKQTIKSLEKLLGEVRKQERYTENGRIYTPRSKARGGGAK